MCMIRFVMEYGILKTIWPGITLHDVMVVHDEMVFYTCLQSSFCENDSK